MGGTTCPPPIVYCTAGTTTNGCNASMSWSGSPSVAASAGFTVSCSNVEGQRNGIMFYGIAGPNAFPWGSGSTSFVCVKSPLQRIAPASSAGTAGSCDGSFSLDVFGYASANPTALGLPFSAGESICCQAWFRDPSAPSAVNLSNAVNVTFWP